MLHVLPNSLNARLVLYILLNDVVGEMKGSHSMFHCERIR